MNNTFPENFFWGASTSSHQVEGNNINNDWWEWEQNGNTEASENACDHYHRFKEDFLLAKELGHNAHRLGIEWSRAEKNKGEWDQSEWDHYKSILDELNKLGIEPFVTLNHFTVPLWFSRMGSWTNYKSIELFTRFAVKAIKELGDRVQYWIPFNEPNILAILAYFYGEWTPCRKNFDEALIVLKNMLKSHVKSYELMHEYANHNPNTKKPKIGIAKAVTAFHPCSKYSILDRLCTHKRNKFHNHSFILSAIRGKVLIQGLPVERLSINNATDFIGLNYYFRQFIHHKKNFIKNPLGEVCNLAHHPESGDITDMGWEIYPKGIYEVIKNFKRYKLPIFITENGLATDNDTIRQRYIKDHLSQVLKAIKEGIPVKGYLHWSLMDNFEWAEGYSKRFGLIKVDFKTQKRTIRDSAKYYQLIIEKGIK